MGNILILYNRLSANTKTMAEYVKHGTEKYKSAKVKLFSVDEVEEGDILRCDGIAVGSPTNCGMLSWKMKKFRDEKVGGILGKIDSKIGCAFSPSGGFGGGAELTFMSIVKVLMNFGFLVFGVIDYVDDKYTLHYCSIVAGEPREKREIKACEHSGERLSNWIEHFSSANEKSNINNFKK